MGINPLVQPKHFWCFNDESGSDHDKPEQYILTKSKSARYATVVVVYKPIENNVYNLLFIVGKLLIYGVYSFIGALRRNHERIFLSECTVLKNVASKQLCYIKIISFPLWIRYQRCQNWHPHLITL